MTKKVDKKISSFSKKKRIVIFLLQLIKMVNEMCRSCVTNDTKPIHVPNQCPNQPSNKTIKEEKHNDGIVLFSLSTHRDSSALFAHIHKHHIIVTFIIYGEDSFLRTNCFPTSENTEWPILPNITQVVLLNHYTVFFDKKSKLF